MTDEEWQEILISTFKCLDEDVLVNEVLVEALANAGISQPVPQRLWCCRALGALGKILPAKRIEETFLKKALDLSQDTDHEVRSCMAEQMGEMAISLGYVFSMLGSACLHAEALPFF